jgi:hypothetical protein
MADPHSSGAAPVRTSTTKPATLHAVDNVGKAPNLDALASRLDGDLSTVEIGCETLTAVLAAFPLILKSGEGLAPSLGWIIDKLGEDVAAMRASFHKLNVAIL